MYVYINYLRNIKWRAEITAVTELPLKFEKIKAKKLQNLSKKLQIFYF